MITIADKYQLIDYIFKYHLDLLSILDQGYKDIGYTELELQGIDSDLREIEKIYAQPSCFKLLFDKEELIASIAIKINSGSQRAELKRVSVKKSHRGLGISEALSIWAFDYCKNLQIQELDIWSGTKCQAAHHIYQKLGAVDSGNSKELGGQDEVIEKHFIKVLY